MLKGEIELKLVDKNGKLKYHKKMHNTVTRLGKTACIAHGLSNLFTPIDLAGISEIVDALDTGSPTANNNTYDQAAILKCCLLNKADTSTLEGESVQQFNNEVVGYADNATSEPGSGTNKGFVTPSVNPNDNKLYAFAMAGNKISASYKFQAGVAGTINAIAMMYGAGLTYYQEITNEEHGDTDQTYPNILPPYFSDNVPENCVALSYNVGGNQTWILYNYQTGQYSIPSATPAIKSGITISNTGTMMLKMFSVTGYKVLLNLMYNYGYTPYLYVHVYNESTGTVYSTGTQVNNSRAITAKKDGDTIYICVGSSTACYRVDITSSSVSLTSVSASTYFTFNGSDISVDSAFGYNMPFGNKYLLNNNSAQSYIRDTYGDQTTAGNLKLCGEGYSAVASNRAGMTSNPLILDDVIISEGRIAYYAKPGAGKPAAIRKENVGNLISYKVLDEAITKEAADTLTVTYTYTFS